MGDYETLKSLIQEIDVLLEKHTDSSSTDFKAWKNRARRFLIKHFGEDSFEYRDFDKIRFSLAVFSNLTEDSRFVEACTDGLCVAKAVFSNYLSEMDQNQVEQSARIWTDSEFPALLHISPQTLSW